MEPSELDEPLSVPGQDTPYLRIFRRSFGIMQMKPNDARVSDHTVKDGRPNHYPPASDPSSVVESVFQDDDQASCVSQEADDSRYGPLSPPSFKTLFDDQFDKVFDDFVNMFSEDNFGLTEEFGRKPTARQESAADENSKRKADFWFTFPFILF